jgi:DNA-binding MarR family transcriptional regulator
MADDDRWLTAAELATWRAYLVSHAHLMRALDQQLQRDSGISHTDYALLTRLSAHGSATMNELAEMLEHSQSRTSHAVARLEGRGFVVREAETADRRMVRVQLTDAGRAVQAAAAPGHVRCVREHLFDAVTSEQVTALWEVCTAMLERLGRPAPS